MDARLYVGNLSKTTTQDEINALFTQAGVVTVTEVIRDRKSGESKGFGFVTMSAQEEAEKAISMFNGYELGGKELKVSIAKAERAASCQKPGSRTVRVLCQRRKK